MTLWPGDLVEGDGGAKFTLGRMVAYVGGEKCANPRCRRMFGTDLPPEGQCVDYHCGLCDEPCSMVGHNCPRAKGLEQESR